MTADSADTGAEPPPVTDGSRAMTGGAFRTGNAGADATGPDAAGRDATGQNVTRAAVAVCFTPNANALKFAGVRHGSQRAALDCGRRKRAASSRNRLKFHNALAGELSASDAARCLTGNSVQKRQVRADGRSSHAAVPVEVKGGGNEGSRESTRELVVRCFDALTGKREKDRDRRN